MEFVELRPLAAMDTWQQGTCSLLRSCVHTLRLGVRQQATRQATKQDSLLSGMDVGADAGGNVDSVEMEVHVDVELEQNVR